MSESPINPSELVEASFAKKVDALPIEEKKKVRTATILAIALDKAFSIYSRITTMRDNRAKLVSDWKKDLNAGDVYFGFEPTADERETASSFTDEVLEKLADEVALKKFFKEHGINDKSSIDCRLVKKGSSYTKAPDLLGEDEFKGKLENYIVAQVHKSLRVIPLSTSLRNNMGFRRSLRHEDPTGVVPLSEILEKLRENYMATKSPERSSKRPTNVRDIVNETFDTLNLGYPSFLLCFELYKKKIKSLFPDKTPSKD